MPQGGSPTSSDAAWAGLGARVAGLLLAATALAAPGCAPERRPPSVVLVSFDTLRADALGSFGYPRETTPRLDAFLAGSVRFTRAYAPEPHTLPSHVSLFTSLHPLSHGVEGWLSHTSALPEDALTLAEILADAGYATAAFVNGGFMHPKFGLDQGFGTYDWVDDLAGDAEASPHAAGRNAGETNRAIFEWLDQAPAPFFLFVHYFDIHSDAVQPYEAPPDYLELFDALEPIDFAPGNPTGSTFLTVANALEMRIPPRLLQKIRAQYDAGVRYTDDRFGELLEGLRSRGLYEGAVVVVLSDHGEEFQEHGRLLHTQLYQESLRVPLGIKLPAHEEVAPGERSEAVRIVDLMPTLLDYLGLDREGALQGRSLLPALRGAPPAPEEPLLFYSSLTRELGLLDGGWKWIHDPAADRTELYHLESDPAEGRDRSAEDPERVRAGLATLRRAYRAQRAAPGPRAVPVDLDEATRRRLEALGYVR